uniref:CD109 antigen-like n=1 Tax=Saccoglossus kowalevskii TaxID=10224 RepID=A0ABM0LZ22_SACKO|nr:PREDICTED: CD109 antigen-like [Saccoglossus kowalevskii]
MDRTQMVSIWIPLSLFCMLWMSTVAATNSYVVLCPKKVRPGVPITISAHILESTGTVAVTASLGTDQNNPVDTTTASCMEGIPEELELSLPADYEYNPSQGPMNLYISGSGGGLSFFNETQVTVDLKSMSVLIQTDKGIYKPGQTVKFRALAISPSGLNTYTGTFDVQIKDPNGNVIKQWKDLEDSDGFGVIQNEMVTSKEPVLGTWIIDVTATESGVSEEKEFVIDEYVLPKYEVSLTLPSFLDATVPIAGATVKAEYTYGKPVKGSVLITLSLVDLYGGFMQESYNNGRSKEITISTLDGSADFEIKKSDLESLNNGIYPDASELSVTAVVTETLTGLSQETTTTVTCHNKPVKVEFLEMTPDNFKPGLTFNAFVSVTLQDGTPLRASDSRQVQVSTKYDSNSANELELSVPDTGLVTITIPDVPPRTQSISVSAWYYDNTDEWQRSNIYAEKALSPSSNYLQLTTATDSLSAGDNVAFTVRATESIYNFVFEVKSRGTIVTTGTVNAAGASTMDFHLTATHEMAPTAKVVVYYVRNDGEVVVDTMNINVEGTFENQVALELSTDEALPADEVNIVVNSSPNSYVAILAVDQSVLLLRGGNDITQQQVIDEIRTYEDEETLGWGGGGPMPMNDMIMFRRKKRSALKRSKRMIWPGYWSPGGNDAASLFSNAGLLVLSDALVYDAFPTNNWSKSYKGLNDGKAVFTSTVPDTITSWVTSALSVSSDNGIGVVPSPATLRVFKPFFITLNMPYSVVRGEDLVLQALVFNYMSKDLSVVVTLAKSDKYDNIQYTATSGNELEPQYTSEDKTYTKMVNSGQGVSFSFPITPRDIGFIEVTISAQSSDAADAVTRLLLVKPEGVPVSSTQSAMIELITTDQTEEIFTISLPPVGVVEGSVRAELLVTGDLLGVAMNNLEQLLRMPTGCGEQNMIGFAPDVFIYKYLVNTNQDNNEIKQKALNFMTQGYQRELNYKHEDGSFSAFGARDDSGSNWLTAFVVKSFVQAMDFVFIDPKIIIDASSWLVDTQSNDGSFPEVGKVVDGAMIQGGISGKTSLTAYILIALMQENDMLDGEIPADLKSDITRAKNSATSYLESHFSSLNDLYSVAIVSYALHLVQSSWRDMAFQKLNTFKTEQDGLAFWSENNGPVDDKPQNYWYYMPPSADIEITGYALLTYNLRRDLDGAGPIVRWLTKQSNGYGGYSSTQDTVIALEALSEFAIMTGSGDKDITLVIETNELSTSQHTLVVNNDNSVVLQQIQEAFSHDEDGNPLDNDLVMNYLCSFGKKT